MTNSIIAERRAQFANLRTLLHRELTTDAAEQAWRGLSWLRDELEELTEGARVLERFSWRALMGRGDESDVFAHLAHGLGSLMVDRLTELCSISRKVEEGAFAKYQGHETSDVLPD